MEAKPKRAPEPPSTPVTGPAGTVPGDGAAAPAPAPLEFSTKAEAAFQKICEAYVDPGMRVLPTLYLAQSEFGWISDEAMRLVAEKLVIPTGYVRSVVSFYTMFHTRPVGRYHVQVCMSLPCALRGSDETWAQCKRLLGVEPGEITADGLFSLTKVECLALCDRAPVLQVNDEDHLDVNTEDRLRALLDDYRQKAKTAPKKRNDGA